MRPAVFGLIALLAPALACAELCDPATYPQKREACLPYACEYVNPFTGEKLTRTIEGPKGAVCVFGEQMPNHGQLTCKVPAAKLKNLDMNAALKSGECVASVSKP